MEEIIRKQNKFKFKKIKQNFGGRKQQKNQPQQNQRKKGNHNKKRNNEHNQGLHCTFY